MSYKPTLNTEFVKNITLFNVFLPALRMQYTLNDSKSSTEPACVIFLNLVQKVTKQN